MPTPDIQDIELELFARGLQLRHGHDFSMYSQASFKRRVLGLVQSGGFDSISALTDRMLREADYLPQILAGLSVPVSEMFRDPEVFRLLRERVLPMLASYPQINIWQAGCAFGQETYSLAILLEEAGLYDRSRIFATDFSDLALHRARESIYPIRDARLYSQNYLAAGGQRSLSDYYHARYDFIKLDQHLQRNVTFLNHNLASDGVFCEAHLVVCRNVLIYFSDALQERALKLMRDSLVRQGFLCLGNRESLDHAPSRRDFVPIDASARVYRLAAGTP
jgi:chemotaxis protein methyltransferase CheR